MKDYNPRKAIALYLCLTFAISSIFYTLIIRAGTMMVYGGAYVYALMWSPAVAAIISTLILRRPFRAFGWKPKPWRLMLASWYVPLLYAAISYIIIWSFGWGTFLDPEKIQQVRATFHLTMPTWALIALFFGICTTLGLLQSLLTATGEEIGWRGFLVPELYKVTSYTKTSLISGIVWSVWHYPILLFADYNSGTPAWYGLSCFTIMVVSISFVFTWFRLKSKTLWSGAMLHASHNLYIQSFFTSLTLANVHTKWFADEFGIVLPLVCVGFAIYYWRRRHELEPAAANPPAA